MREIKEGSDSCVVSVLGQALRDMGSGLAIALSRCSISSNVEHKVYLCRFNSNTVDFKYGIRARCLIG